MLRHVEGYELVDIGAALDCSLSTIKRVLLRAEAKIATLARRDPVLASYFTKEVP